MNNQIESLSASLQAVRTSREFEKWVRFELRRHLPHAAFLGTLGKLYGVGSLPTHRVGVDFPLNMVEELKNNVGAIDDPLMYGWFRSERPRHIDIEEVEEFGLQQQWRKTLVDYGMRSMLIHGVLDHAARRFAVFQIGNPYAGGSQETVQLLSAMVKPMCQAAWSTIDRRSSPPSRSLVGHPTLSLTATELQIVEMLAQGMSNKEIARRRGVSDSTVKTQVSRTGAKLGATRRAEIVAIAMPMLSPLPPQTIVQYGS